MQKLLNYFLMLATMILCGGALASCSDDDEPGGSGLPLDALEVNLLKTEATSANFEILSKNMQECAYKVMPAESAEEPEQETLYEQGTHLTLDNDSTTFRVENLEATSKYVLYLVGKNKAGSFYKKTISVEFETIDFAEKLAIKLVEAKAVNAVFEINSKNIKEGAYMVVPAADAKQPTQDVLFAKGTHVAIDKDPLTFEVSNLNPTSDYVLYFVGKTTSDEFFKETMKVEFTTQDFTDIITVTETRHNGFSVHVKVPDSIKARGNALRFTRGSLPYYNMFKMLMHSTDADMLLSNGGDDRSTADAKTYTFDEEHSFVFDEEMGEEVQIDNPIVAGEPSVFIAGEFTWGESMYGWGEGYYEPCFDFDSYFENMGGGDGGMLLNVEEPTDEDQFWTGYHHRQVIVSNQPAKLDSQLKITQEKLTPINAVYNFEPAEDIYGYSVLIIDDATFNDMVMKFLDNNPDYLQWFVTSYMAYSELGAQTFFGPNKIELGNFIFEDAIQPGLKFHMLVTALGDENGTKQNFQHIEIVMPERTKEAPVIEVKPIDNPEGENSPYEVWFNLKSVGKEPLMKAQYVANYDRDMEYMFQNGYDPASLVLEKGNPFTDDEIMAINSEEGYNVKFESRADATTYLVAIGFNDEGLESEAVLAKAHSLAIPAEPTVDSPYLTSLVGDWTAKATVVFWDYSTSNWSEPADVEFKVNIANGVDYPATLPADVYDLYEGKTKEEVDALYGEFKDCATNYAQKLKDHNCLVCTGFDVTGSDESQLQTPYDLFVSPTYSGFNNEAIFYDFGPKWIIRVNQDGTLSAPVNMNQMDPMSNWRVKYGRRNVFHFVGLGKNSYVGFPGTNEDPWPAFPVTVSEDNKTVTVAAMEGHDNSGAEDKFYPNMIEITYNGAQPAAGCKIISDLTLTKGWTETAAYGAKGHGMMKYNGKKFVSSNNGKYTPKARPAARTAFVKAPNKAGKAVITPVTYEQAQKNMKAAFNKMLKKIQKK